MCNANKLPLFAGVFSTPPVFPYNCITTVHVQRTLHIWWLRIRSTGAQVHGKPHFHSLTIVRAAPDWPTLVYYNTLKHFIVCRLVYFCLCVYVCFFFLGRLVTGSLTFPKNKARSLIASSTKNWMAPGWSMSGNCDGAFPYVACARQLGCSVWQTCLNRYHLLWMV